MADTNTERWIKGTIIAETEKAILFRCIDEDGEILGQFWFPFSQVSQITRQPRNSTDLDKIKVAEWLLTKSGI